MFSRTLEVVHICILLYSFKTVIIERQRITFDRTTGEITEKQMKPLMVEVEIKPEDETTKKETFGKEEIIIEKPEEKHVFQDTRSCTYLYSFIFLQLLPRIYI
jgi:hypothetical protein